MAGGLRPRNNSPCGLRVGKRSEVLSGFRGAPIQQQALQFHGPGASRASRFFSRSAMRMAEKRLKENATLWSRRCLHSRWRAGGLSVVTVTGPNCQSCRHEQSLCRPVSQAISNILTIIRFGPGLGEWIRPVSKLFITAGTPPA